LRMFRKEGEVLAEQEPPRGRYCLLGSRDTRVRFSFLLLNK
jgi:hypothetical protein